MEDIRRRVEYDNVSLQLQAVEKLYNEIKKKTGGQILTTSCPESIEVKSLWQFTCVDQHTVARHSCQMWLQLLHERHADFTYVLNGLLNQVPSASNLQGIVETIGELLILQVLLKSRDQDKYVCPYGIRSPPHPFISVLTNRPVDSWPLLLEQLGRLFTHSQNIVKNNALSILDPFVKFVLLDPKYSDQYASLRSGLKVALIDVVSRYDDRNVCCRYLLDILMNMKMSTAQTLTEVTQFCEQLLHLYGKKTASIGGDSGKRLITFALTMCLQNNQQNLGFTKLADAVLNAGRAKSQMLVADGINLGILGQLMLNTYHSDNIVLLTIVKTILKTSDELLPVCCGFVVMAAANILATPKMVTMASTHKIMISLASEILVIVQEKMNQDLNQLPRTDDKTHTILTVPGSYNVQTCVQLAGIFSKSPHALEQWLKSLKDHLSSMTSVPVYLTNLLVALLIMVPNTDMAKLAVDRLLDIAKVVPTQALYLLPVLLFALGKKTCPVIKLYIMEALPKLATHKYNVAPILKTIQGFGISPKLASMSLKLLTDLWSIQDRCFPHLLKVITANNQSSVTMATVADDIMLARARAIKEVCRLRPEQHGSDMLAPLSQILNTCTDERGTPVASLAMEGLIYICQAEVIDIMSAWRVLETNLTKETRPVVVVQICKLLGLVPELQVKSEEYEMFLSETVRRLWLYGQTDDANVTSAAFEALSNFTVDQFKISHFQYQIVQEYVVQAEALLATSDQEDDTIDTVILAVPGVCYTRLMSQLQSGALNGYETFLCSMVNNEVENLPRGIHYTSLRQRSSSSNESKAVSSIPAFIQGLYEKTKQPGLRPGLAAGLLFCYDPQVEVSRDGRPRKHYALTHGKNYQQMFTSLMHDIPVQPSDWHKTMLMSRAWSDFTDRLFSSMLQARKAEIDLQLTRDFIDEQEAEEKNDAAWLWVRDSIVDMIKKATKGNPSVQSNAILALSGLSNAVYRYAIGLGKDEKRRADDITEHTSHSHWLLMVIDSLMSLVDFTFKPKSALIGLCQQRTADDRLPASVLAQAASILALCELVPILMANYIELVDKLVTFLTQRLPGQQDDIDCPPVLHIFHGLSLGLLISKLIQESYADVAGAKGSMVVMKTQDSLEECCFSTSQHRSGAILGLAVGLGALCVDGKTESRVHVVSMHGRLLHMLHATKSDDPVYQPLCMCIAMVTGTGVLANVINSDTAYQTFTLLLDIHKNNKECGGVSVSIGSLCYILALDNSKMTRQKQILYTDWLESGAKIDNSALERVASLSGLMALVGSEKSFIPTDLVSMTTQSGQGVTIDTAVVKATQIVKESEDIGIQGNAAWLLGNLYLSQFSSSQNSSSVPSSYNFLPEGSVLRAVIDFLISAGKQGPEVVNSRHIEMCLKSCQGDITRTLPPLNWAGILSPLIKMQFDDKVKLLSLQLAVKLCGSSPTATLFLSSWIVPPLFNTLPVSCQNEILSSSGMLIKAVTPSQLQAFLDKSCTAVYTQDKQERQLRINVLKGLNSALMVKDPPASVVAMLYRMITKLYDLSATETNPEVLEGLSTCLLHVPPRLLDELTTDDCNTGAVIIRGTYVRCHMVGGGHQPIAFLNSCIDAAFNMKCDQSAILNLLMGCLYKMTRVESSNTRVLPRQQWLVEFMGHIRNIAMGTFKLTNQQADLQEVFRFALNVIASAICLWTSIPAAAVLGLTYERKDGHVIDEPHYDWLKDSHKTIEPIGQLKGHIQKLDVEPWSQIIPKVLEWLLAMSELPILDGELRQNLIDCLAELRHTSDFGKAAIWTKAVLLNKPKLASTRN